MKMEKKLVKILPVPNSDNGENPLQIFILSLELN
jgi:hypothetical protein